VLVPCLPCANHVGKCLITPLNHGVRLQVSAGDDLVMHAVLALKVNLLLPVQILFLCP